LKVGLYFGSFNPIHLGHLIIASYLYEHSDLDEVWFVVSPHNPLKSKSTLLEDHHRLEMVFKAVEDYQYLNVSDIEFKLAKPSYTVDTLVNLKEKYENHEFTLIMGQDNLTHLHKWKNYKVLLEDYELMVYPRITGEKVPSEYINHPRVHFLKAPIIELSSSAIRKDIFDKKSVRAYMPQSSWEYLDRMNFYKPK
jgi:nicotinate-nucleotide adenylyltransferase